MFPLPHYLTRSIKALRKNCIVKANIINQLSNVTGVGTLHDTTCMRRAQQNAPLLA